MENKEKSEFRKKFKVVKRKPLKLFSQEEFPWWGKLCLGIVMSLTLFVGVVLCADQIYNFISLVINKVPQNEQNEFYLYFFCFVVLFILMVISMKLSLKLYNKNLIKNPTYKELFLVLGAVLNAVKTDERRKHTQGSIKACILTDFPITVVGDSRLDRIFAEANRRIIEHQNENNSQKQ